MTIIFQCSVQKKDNKMNLGVPMNSWPGGERHAIYQSEHDTWNAMHYPGTRQICVECGNPTERCEDDSLYFDDIGPLCKACFDELEEEQNAIGLSLIEHYKPNSESKSDFDRAMRILQSAILKPKSDHGKKNV